MLSDITEFYKEKGCSPIIYQSMLDDSWFDEIQEEPWEIKVAKKTLDCPESWMFAASMNGKIVGLLYGHISERACRVDYLIVSKKHRKAGVGRALFYNYVEWCRHNGINNVYIWPDGETPKEYTKKAATE